MAPPRRPWVAISGRAVVLPGVQPRMFLETTNGGFRQVEKRHLGITRARPRCGGRRRTVPRVRWSRRPSPDGAQLVDKYAPMTRARSSVLARNRLTTVLWCAPSSDPAFRVRRWRTSSARCRSSHPDFTHSAGAIQPCASSHLPRRVIALLVRWAENTSPFAEAAHEKRTTRQPSCHGSDDR